jgi:hypothetical protein
MSSSLVLHSGFRRITRLRARLDLDHAFWFVISSLCLSTGVSCQCGSHIGGEFSIESVTLDGGAAGQDGTSALVELPGGSLKIHPAWTGMGYYIVQFWVQGYAQLTLERFEIEASHFSDLSDNARPEYLFRETVESRTHPLALPEKLSSGNCIDMYVPALDRANTLHRIHIVINDRGRRHTIEIAGRRRLPSSRAR